jgi:hypothetical protein
MPRRRLAVIAFLVGGLLALPFGYVLASHQFGDVPDSNIYHNDIDALADSGVTSGCGGGNFCPSAFVTREQMAAFMNRLGALAAGKKPVVNADRLDGLDSMQFARADVPVTGHANCAGAVLDPNYAGLDYTTFFVTGRSLTSGTGGVFHCGLSFPDGATITALQARVFDTSGTEYVDCRLSGASLEPGVDFIELAYTGSSGPSATLGDQVLEDLTIDHALVDNAAWAYFASCQITGSGTDVAIYGVSAEYTVEGLPVP